MSTTNNNIEDTLAQTLRLPQLGSPQERLQDATNRAERAQELQEQAAEQGRETQEVIDQTIETRRGQVEEVNQLADILDTRGALRTIEEAREVEARRAEVRARQSEAGAEASRAAAQQHTVNTDREQLNQTYYQRNQAYLEQAAKVEELRQRVDESGFLGKFWYGSQLRTAEQRLLETHQQTLVATQQKAINTASLVDELNNITTITEAEYAPQLAAANAQVEQAAVALQAYSRQTATIGDAINLVQSQLGLDQKYVDLLQSKAELMRGEMRDNLNIAQSVITSVLQEANYEALQRNVEETANNRESRQQVEDSFDRFKNQYGVETEFGYQQLMELARNGDQEALRITQQWSNARAAEEAGVNSIQAALFAQGTPGVNVTPAHETTIQFARAEVNNLNQQVYNRLREKYDLDMTFEEAMNSEEFAQSPAYAEFFEEAVSLENPEDYERIQSQIDAVRASLQHSDTVNSGFERGVISIENISEYFDDPEVKERFRPYLDELTMQMLDDGEFDGLNTRIQDVNTDLARIAQERAEAVTLARRESQERAQQLAEASANFLAVYMQQQQRRYQSNRLPELSNFNVKYQMQGTAGAPSRNVTLDLTNPEDWKLLFSAQQEVSRTRARNVTAPLTNF